MTLRAKLFLAQAPLAAALLILAVVSFHAARSIGERSQAILQDNYRSVLATQRMKEYADRLDSAALYGLNGAEKEFEEQAARYRPRFEEELKTQEANITEHGEKEATAVLRGAWEEYQKTLDAFTRRGVAERRSFFFQKLQPDFQRVKDGADTILNLNQDAMVAKSDVARREATEVRRLLVALSVAALALGLLSSLWITRRLLGPLMFLTQSARRIGEGDLATRAPVYGQDEIAALAGEFNRMTEHLAEYRRSSLGELLQAQQASQAAIDSLPDPILVFDNDAHVLSFNEAAEALMPGLSTSTSEALAKVEPALRDGIAQVRRFIAEGRGAYHPKGYEEAIRFAAREGDRFFLPRGSPVYGESGEVAGATVVLQDVTKLRRFDELKNDLVATVAHEMRTPLTSLGMSLHICLDQGIGPLNDKQADLLFAAREDFERLQKIVDEILDLARIQSGRVELHRQPVAVRDIVSQAVEAHHAELTERNLTLDVLVFDSMRVTADPERIQLVIGNLLSNAIKYSPASTKVEIGAKDEGAAVRFFVTDHGPGISRDVQARIFEKFFRSTTMPGGAGLGLYIAQEIVQAHGGQIGVESEPGQGSTFWFRIPKAA